MRRLLIWVVLFLNAATLALAAPQDQPKVGNAAAEDFIRAAQGSSDPVAKRIFRATQSQEPRFIFVPGMFGSRLTVVKEDGSKQDIWGGDANAFATGPLRYDPTQKVETAALDSLDFIATHQDIYGDALANLASHSVDKRILSIFSYDWRRDNVDSAAQLQAFLCNMKSELVGHKVYIIAHSMGGLVTKYWHENYRNLDCATAKPANNDDWLDLQEVILVGTPLYGAPSAIEAFGGKFGLLPGGDFPVFGGLFRQFDQATVSSQFIEHGPLFESAYELLPVYMEGCVGAEADLQPIKVRANDNSLSSVGSLFLSETWENLGWPPNLPDYEPRDTYYHAFLPEALQHALNFLCDVANYDIGKNVPTTYYYGLLPDTSTITAFEIRKVDGVGQIQDDCKVAADDCHALGDGTVPEFVARNEFVASRQNARSVPMSHMELMKAPDLDAYVRNIVAEDTKQALRATLTAELVQNPDSSSTISHIAVQERLFLPADLCCSGAGDPIAQINKQTMAELGIDRGQIALLARTATDPDAVGQWTSLLALSPDAKPAEIFQGYDRAGLLAHSDQDFQAAIKAWDGAIYVSKSIPAEQVRSDLGDIYVLRGDSFAKLGDLDGAKSAYGSAISLGSDAGAAGLKGLQDFSAPGLGYGPGGQVFGQ